jgi:formyl-CoA transferase
VEAFLGAGVPPGPIYDFEQVFAAEHTHARGMRMTAHHPVEGEVPMLGFPVKLSDTPQRLRHPPPLLAQHTAEVLGALGLGGEMDRLRREGAFGP